MTCEFPEVRSEALWQNFRTLFDFGSLPAASGQNLRSRYRFKVVRHRHYFADQEFGWYWTLKFDDERINGGIATDWEDGARRARRTMLKDEATRFHDLFFLDYETSRWLPRSELR
jgi:hypothetical protein